MILLRAPFPYMCVRSVQEFLRPPLIFPNLREVDNRKLVLHNSCLSLNENLVSHTVFTGTSIELGGYCILIENPPKRRSEALSVKRLA